MITFEQFAREKNITLRGVRWLAKRADYTHITHAGCRYDLIQRGSYANGAPMYFIVKNDGGRKKRHLSADQREAALDMLHELMSRNEASAINRVAEHFGVSYHSVYRLWNERKVERKRREDAGQTRKIIPQAARDFFESIYVQNAQGPNVKVAYDLTKRQFSEWDLPLKYFRRFAAQIEPERLRLHQESGFEREYAPRIRRDMWSEFEYMQRVSMDGWTVPDRVLRKFGLGEMTKKKFTFKNRECSVVVICAVEQKTGDVIAFKAFERSVTKEDVLSLLIDVIQRRGRPTDWLLDNGTEFTNDAVQRFLRGLYTTEEHEVRERVIFSEPYGPFGKARHERMHKIFKDEFCAFSRSYAPNAQESRKPSKKLSYVEPTHTLDEWVAAFTSYLNGFFRERQRTNWMHPLYSRNAGINANRPRTLNEAVERAYASFTKVEVDPMTLAFLYASKFPAKVRQGLFHAPAKIGLGRKLRYLCPTLPTTRYRETFEVVVNPLNIAQAWVCDMKNTIVGEAWDIQAKNAGSTVTRDEATVYRKQRNRLNKLTREAAEVKAQLVDMDEQFKPSQPVIDPVELHDAEEQVFATVNDQLSSINDQPSTEMEIEPEYYFEQTDQSQNIEGNNG